MLALIFINKCMSAKRFLNGEKNHGAASWYCSGGSCFIAAVKRDYNKVIFGLPTLTFSRILGTARDLRFSLHLGIAVVSR